MKHALFLIPLLLCALGGGFADADDLPGAKEKVASQKAAVKQALKKRVSVTLEDAPVADAVDHLTEITGLEVVLEAEVDGTITLKLINVSAGAALHAIADASELDVKLTKAGVVRLTRKKEQDVHLFDVRDLLKADVDVVKRVRRAHPTLVVERMGDKPGVILVKGSMEEIAVATKLLDELRIDGANRFVLSKEEQRALKEELDRLREVMRERQAASAAAREKGDLEAVRKRLQEIDELARRRAETVAKIKRLHKASKASKALKAPKAPKVPMPPKAPKPPTLHEEAVDAFRASAEKLRVVERLDVDHAEVLVDKAHKLQERAEQARLRGRNDEAEKLQQKAREYMKKALAQKAHGLLERSAAKRREDAAEHKDEFVEFSEVRRRHLKRDNDFRELTSYAGRRNAGARLEHLRLAHRSLKAAGMHEQAEHVAREMRELEAHMHQGGRGESGSDVMHAIHALREEVHGLRAEVQMLTALVKKLLPARAARRAPR